MENHPSNREENNVENLSDSNGERKCEALPDYFLILKSLVDHCHNNTAELDKNTNDNNGDLFLDGQSKQ